MQKTSKNKTGQLIIESLTKNQLAVFLELICRPSILSSIMDDLKKADEDMAKTLKKIMNRKPGSAAENQFTAAASEMRLLERWRELWESWADHVSEVGDEDGKYANHDEPWHPPYFDGSALAFDLEPIAEQMLGLADKVFSLVENDELFEDALVEIDENIEAYPEMMAVESYDGCELGENASRCALKWAWLTCEKLENSGKAFLGKTHRLDTALDMVSLDSETIWEFFTGLPDDVCRQIYTTLINNAAKYDVDNIRNAWHRIFHDFEQKFDPDSYLETCREHLAENWRYGIPLVEDAYQAENYQMTEKYLEHTFSSYLRMKEEKWRPETSLLKKSYWGPGKSDEEEIIQLLETWAEAAGTLDRFDRKAAALFQTGAFRFMEDWDAVMDHYKSLSGPESAEALKPLFESWKTEMVQRSAGYSFGKYNPESTWVYWLLEACESVSLGKGWFAEKISGWLYTLGKNQKMFQKEAAWLALFTGDAPGAEDAAEKHPSFYRAAVYGKSRSSDILSNSRRKALKTMDAGQFLKQVLGVWKKRLASLIPEPSAGGRSNYEENALWMNALYELNPDDYRTVLNRWREEHGRKRNLWRDMKVRKLPV